MRGESRYELDQLHRCLERVALQIDEDRLNRFMTDDFEPIVDDVSDSESEDGSLEEGNDFQETTSQQQQQTGDWEPFANWGPESQRKQADSPTVDTVVTSGTESMEQYEISSDESDKEPSEPQRLLQYSQDFYDDDEGDYHDEQPPSRFHHVEFELDAYFLERIANEDVKYETDSEAMDSWAQDADSVAPSESSGGVTYDPARLALRTLLDRCPGGMESPPVKEERAKTSMDAAKAAVESLLGERSDNENTLESVIDDFLNDSFELENYSAPRPTPTPAGKENQADSSSPFVEPDVLEQSEWVSFDSDNHVQEVEFSSVWNVVEI